MEENQNEIFNELRTNNNCCFVNGTELLTFLVLAEKELLSIFEKYLLIEKLGN